MMCTLHATTTGNGEWRERACVRQFGNSSSNKNNNYNYNGNNRNDICRPTITTMLTRVFVRRSIRRKSPQQKQSQVLSDTEWIDRTWLVTAVVLLLTEGCERKNRTRDLCRLLQHFCCLLQDLSQSRCFIYIEGGISRSWVVGTPTSPVIGR